LLSTPDFLLATFFLVFFVVVIPLFPATSLVTETTTLIGWIKALFMPSLVLSLAMAVYAVRLLRDNLIEVLEADFVRMAELKGLSSHQVLWRHALPNALIPTLNVTALNIAYLLGGVVIVERVFTYPGFGSLMVDALQLRDATMTEATVLIAAIIYICSNLFADVGSIILNPRLRRTY
jgi:peptide/nickel transport system permease protein